MFLLIGWAALSIVTQEGEWGFRVAEKGFLGQGSRVHRLLKGRSADGLPAPRVRKCSKNLIRGYKGPWLLTRC